MQHDPAAANNPNGLIESSLANYNEHGVLELRRVTGNVPNVVRAQVRGKQSGYWFEITISVNPDRPDQIAGRRWGQIDAPPDLLEPRRLSEEEIAQRADELISHLIKADLFSGAILIAKDGKPIYQRAAGLASRTWDIPNRIDTKFNLASIGKMFTGVAVAQLVEQEKLKYDDTVGSILPDYPNKEVAQKVLVRHLLSHTSGLPTMAPGVKAGEDFAGRYRTLSEYLPAFANEAPAFEPGTKYLYSNCGYNLLGAIIEKVSGQSFQDYIREHIFKPAGMNDTDNGDMDMDVPNLASGYMDAPRELGGPRRNNAFVIPMRGLPSGLGYSTVGDMVKFEQALRQNKLVTADTLKELWTGRINNNRGGRYCFGFQTRQYNGQRIIFHGGGWFGITNQFEMYPELGYTVVILNNIDSNPLGLATKIGEWLTQGTSK